KDYKPSRRGVDRGTTITKPGTSRVYTSSPYSTRSTASRSKAERNPLKAVGNYKGLGHPIAKSTRKKDYKPTYRKCLDMIDYI
ncbi:hypothetical protein N7489_003549, partial [Penicillium chrysogenum]|uniref:uncharacterized protein n=1 Tax=Penicillium chrysogenum TaxID=5076 RepID=UPI0024DF1F13